MAFGSMRDGSGRRRGRSVEAGAQTRHRTPLLWALLGWAACSSSGSGAHTAGELGNGTFDYTCVSPSDPVCRGGVPAEDFPNCLMVGSQFEISYTVHNTDALDDLGTAFIHVKPASESYFTGFDALVAVQPGNAALVAFADDHVIDILHLQLVEATGLELVYEGISDPPVVEVEVGASVIVEAYGTSTTCAAGGALPVEALSADLGVASASGEGNVTLVGNNEGETVVTVSVGEMSRSFTVRVVPAIDPSETFTTTFTTTDDTTTQADTGSGTDDSGSSDDSGTDSGTSDGSDSGTSMGTDTGETEGTTGTGG